MTIEQTQPTNIIEKDNEYIVEYKPLYKTDARTLQASSIGTHENGWTVQGQIHDDYWDWVNYFEAFKGDMQNKMWVVGDFESKIRASSKEALEDFLRYFEVEFWDYNDI